MAKMSMRGFFNLIESKTYTRFDVPSEYIYNEIVNELRRNNISCNASIERTNYRFKQMESDGKVLFLSERGLFTLFVTLCSVGGYTQLQVITRHVGRRYSFEDANHSLEHAMHNLYNDAVQMCILNAVDRVAAANNWSQITKATNEMEAQ